MSTVLSLRSTALTTLHRKPPAPGLYPALTCIIHLCSYHSVYKPSARALSKPGIVPFAFKHTWNKKANVFNCSLVTNKGNNSESDFTYRYGRMLCVIDGLGQWDGCSPRCWRGSLLHCSQLSVDDLIRTSAGCLTVGRSGKGLFIRVCVAHPAVGSFT